MAFCHDRIASFSFLVVLACENIGINTVRTLPDTIVAKGNCMNPLEYSAKTASPKYRLMKN